MSTQTIFKWRHFQADIILLWVKRSLLLKSSEWLRKRNANEMDRLSIIFFGDTTIRVLPCGFDADSSRDEISLRPK